jgi:flagellar hook-length control protein FliK
MIDISPQISEAFLPGTHAERIAQSSPLEEGQLKGMGFAQKGGSKNGLGAFAKLFAGLLRKNQNISGEKPGVEQTGIPELFNRNQLKEGGGKVKAGETPFKKSLNGAALKKLEKEESTAPPSGQKPEKSGKKTGQTGADIETLVPVQAGTQGKTVLEAEIPANTFAEGLANSEKGMESLQKKAAKPEDAGLTGKKTGKRDETALSAEPQRFSPVFETRKPEKSGEIRPGESPARNKRKERLPVEVLDLRTGLQAETAGAAVNAAAREQELIVELHSAGEDIFTGNSAAETLDSEKTAPAESGKSFESMLAERLSGQLSADIIKQAAIVLRDGGEGTIRLSLKPETLGKVKIHLEMAENKISGHIFVESEEALRAFEQEIHTLEQAFRDSGFSEASLDTALGSGDRRREEGDDTQPFFSSRLAVSSYDAGSEISTSGAFVSGGFSAVNVLV